MHQPEIMQLRQGPGQGLRKLQTVFHRQWMTVIEPGGQGRRMINFTIVAGRALDAVCIICQLHDVVEEALILHPAHMQHINQALMRARHWLAFPNSLELAQIRPLRIKRTSPHDLHRSQRPHDTLRQPHFPIATTSDDAE